MIKSEVKISKTMCEAYSYDKPSAFSRAVKVVTNNVETVYISGTASIGNDGKTKFKGNFEKQAELMFANVASILWEAGLSWHNIIKTTIYFRDIDRDYEQFNILRKEFYDGMELQPYPASVGIQAILCRSDLLIEMEAIAIR